MSETAQALILHTLLATYPSTVALKQGRVHSSSVQFDFADVRIANTAFKSLVRDQTFDVGELAIITYLQAKTFGKPYILLPAIVVARRQHQSILYNAARGHLAPADLNGRRVGVRAYTQTTAAWIRGILEEDYGVDFKGVRWVTFEGSHLSEYRDPAWVERAPANATLVQMLLDGELDAGIFGNELPDVPLTRLIPDADEAAETWAARRDMVPINHMVVVRESFSRNQPDVVREIYRLLLESRNAAPAGAGGDAVRFGVEPNRRALELIIEYAVRQCLIPRRFTVDELFDDTTRALGAA